MRERDMDLPRGEPAAPIGMTAAAKALNVEIANRSALK
jgi:hypothetical protein